MCLVEVVWFLLVAYAAWDATVACKFYQDEYVSVMVIGKLLYEQIHGDD